MITLDQAEYHLYTYPQKVTSPRAVLENLFGQNIMYIYRCRLGPLWISDDVVARKVAPFAATFATLHFNVEQKNEI